MLVFLHWSVRALGTVRGFEPMRWKRVKKTAQCAVFSVSGGALQRGAVVSRSETESYRLRQECSRPETGRFCNYGERDCTMESIAYYDGNIGSPDELVVPFNDRSHFFGDGVYDATIAAGGRVFLLEDHLDRFYSSAAAFDLCVPMDREELASLLLNLVSRVSGPSHFVYWQVTRSFEGVRNHVYEPGEPGKLWVLISPEELEDPKVPLRLITLEDHRFEYCNIKTLNLLPSVMYASQAARAGADEAVLHRNGIVTECAHSNVLILRDGVLYSHPNDQFILRGIAKTHLIQAAWRNAIPVIERPFTLEELRDADEIIVSSSGCLCSFANQLDGAPVGGRDPRTLRILQEAVHKEYRDYCGI